MASWTVARLLSVCADFLGTKGSSSPRLDAELLLGQVLGLDRVHLYTQYDRPLSADEVGAYRELVARRAQHEPVAYILGHAHFRYLVLEVTPHVLIPRPETEELVDAVLEWLRERPLLPPDRPPDDGHAGASVTPRIADVGTGSGAIALSLAWEAHVRVLAIDVSEAALEVAERNRDALGLRDLVEFGGADLLAGVEPGMLRVVVSNPPYVSDAEYGRVDPDVRDFEPAQALRAGADGLDCYRRLLPQAAAVLGPGGALFVEVGDTQAAAVTGLARAAGFCCATTIKDLSGKERIVRAVLPGAVRIGEAGLDAAGVAALRAALAAGAVLGVPTDTVYGLVAAWDSHAGVRRLFAAKARDAERPAGVLFASVDAVRGALPDLDRPTLRVLEALLPGPYTFVVGTGVPRTRGVGTHDSVGVRVPAHPALLRFLEALETPLAATSANISGGSDAVEPDEVDAALLAHCVAALDFEAPAGGVASPTAGPSPHADGSPPGIASTVVDLRPLAEGGQALVLREGAVSAIDIMEQIGKALQ